MFTMLYALSGVDEICETVSDRRTATFMTSNFDDSSELFVIIILNFDRALDVFYKASDKLKLGSFKNVVAWCARLEARPATAKGLLINSSAEGGYPEYHSWGNVWTMNWNQRGLFPQHYISVFEVIQLHDESTRFITCSLPVQQHLSISGTESEEALSQGRWTCCCSWRFSIWRGVVFAVRRLVPFLGDVAGDVKYFSDELHHWSWVWLEEYDRIQQSLRSPWDPPHQSYPGCDVLE